MGLFQRAVETYDAHAALAGNYTIDKVPLAPICHKTAKAEIEICINQAGDFVSAKVPKNDPTTIIPVSVESMARSGVDLSPHPLCDNLKYFIPDNKAEFTKYINALSAWNESEYSHPKLLPILNYVKSGEILRDLAQADVLTYNKNKTEIKENRLVRWSVIGIDGDPNPDCWTDQSLFRSFQEYEQNRLSKTKQSLCMITGNRSFVSDLHRGGVISIPNTANPKLISTNDNKTGASIGFTFLGRFQSPEEAVTISYEASQKAHNALSWLDSKESVRLGGRTFLCWNPKGKKVLRPHLPLMQEKVGTEKNIKPSDYKDALYKTLIGYKTSLTVKDDVVIAAFDSASKGRISVVYYNELLGSIFLDRLYDWDLHCCWPNYQWQYEIQSPTLYDIIK